MKKTKKDYKKRVTFLEGLLGIMLLVIIVLALSHLPVMEEEIKEINTKSSNHIKISKEQDPTFVTVSVEDVYANNSKLVRVYKEYCKLSNIGYLGDGVDYYEFLCNIKFKEFPQTNVLNCNILEKVGNKNEYFGCYDFYSDFTICTKN